MWFGDAQLYALAAAVGLQVAAILFMKGAGLSIRDVVKGKSGGQPGAAPQAQSKRGPKWGLKWAALVTQLIAGGGYAVAFLPAANGIIGWLNTSTAGVLAVVATIVVLALGWWALDGLTAVARDLMDGEPDKEAFRSALLIPTTIPLGFGALWETYTNRQGGIVGFGALAISLLAGIFMHRIIGKINAISTGAKIWRYGTAVICLIVGVAHVPAFVFINDWVNFLPNVQIAGRVDFSLAEAVRCAAVAAAVAIIAYGVGDNVRGDKLPGNPTFWATMYGIPVVLVLGAVFMTGFNSSVDSVFGAFGG